MFLYGESFGGNILKNGVRLASFISLYLYRNSMRSIFMYSFSALYKIDIDITSWNMIKQFISSYRKI